MILGSAVGRVEGYVYSDADQGEAAAAIERYDFGTAGLLLSPFRSQVQGDTMGMRIR
jgi:hypothetical protein